MGREIFRCASIGSKQTGNATIANGRVQLRRIASATATRIVEAWLKTLPLGAVKDSAGMIRNGDTVLCVATAQRAGLNEQRKQQRTAAAMQSATESFANELAKQKVAAKGAEPYVEATVAERPPVPRRKSRKES